MNSPSLQKLSPDLTTYLKKKVVSRETVEKFIIYEEVLVKWKNTASLVQESTLEDFFTRHIIDSLQVADHILPDESILDVGSGAGFPGMVLAILGYNVTMVETITKKTIFLEELARQLDIYPIIINNRIEKVKGQYDVVTARAFSSLSNLIKILVDVSRETQTQPKGVFLKGASCDLEIEDAQKIWEFGCDQIPSITEKNGRILIVKNIRKKE